VKKQLLSESHHSAGVFTQALESDTDFVRGQSGIHVRPHFCFEQHCDNQNQHGIGKDRINDVGNPSESTRLAKYKVLVQASASMRAHANTTKKDILILIR